MDFCVNECDRPEIDYLMSTRTCVILFYQYAHTPSQLSQPPCYSSQLHQVCWVILKMCSVKTRKKIQLLFLAFDKYQQFSFIWSICITSIFPCIIYFPKTKISHPNKFLVCRTILFINTVYTWNFCGGWRVSFIN